MKSTDTMQIYKQSLKIYDLSKAVKNDWALCMIDEQNRIMSWLKVDFNFPESRKLVFYNGCSTSYDNVKKLTDAWGTLIYDDGKDWTPRPSVLMEYLKIEE